MPHSYISATADGKFIKTGKFLKGIKEAHNMRVLQKYGAKGVRELSKATPKDTGLTASSWRYEIEENQNGYKLVFVNDNVAYSGSAYSVNVAILIQLGHATRNGGWVEGIDFINPTLKSVFDDMVQEIWEEVTKY